MNRKQFILALLLVAVVGTAAWLVTRRNAASYSGGGASLGGTVLEGLDINAVAAVTIRDAGGSLTVEKRGDVWGVAGRGGYPADFADVSGFLRELAELKFVEKVSVGESLLPRLELVAPGKDGGKATQVELRDKDGKPLRSLLIGKKYFKRADAADSGGAADGRYVMVDSDIKRVGLVAESLSRAETNPEEWLNKDFVKVENLQSAALLSGPETNRWTLSRTNATAEWTLEGVTPEEKFDTTKASALGSFFSFAGFTDVVPPPVDGAKEGLDNPRVVELKTFDGFQYVLNIGSTNDDSAAVEIKVSASLPASRTAGADEKPEDKERLDKEFADAQAKLKEKLAAEQAVNGWVYRVAKWNLDAVLKERKDFMADPPAPEALPDPAAALNPLAQ